MDVIFSGEHDNKEMMQQLASIIAVFQERYNIKHFKEIHLSMTLLDDQHEEVELIDTETLQVYRLFEVHRNQAILKPNDYTPYLRLVIDNTKN